jgi:hypothetical protein
MMLTLKPNDFDEPSRRDFSVLDYGKLIGRIYESSAYHGDVMWALAGWGSELAPDMETAKARLRAQLARP